MLHWVCVFEVFVFISVAQFIMRWFVDEGVAYVRRCGLDEGLEGGEVVV